MSYTTYFSVNGKVGKFTTSHLYSVLRDYNSENNPINLDVHKGTALSDFVLSLGCKLNGDIIVNVLPYISDLQLDYSVDDLSFLMYLKVLLKDNMGRISGVETMLRSRRINREDDSKDDASTNNVVTFYDLEYKPNRYCDLSTLVTLNFYDDNPNEIIQIYDTLGRISLDYQTLFLYTIAASYRYSYIVVNNRNMLTHLCNRIDNDYAARYSFNYMILSLYLLETVYRRMDSDKQVVINNIDIIPSDYRIETLSRNIYSICDPRKKWRVFHEVDMNADMLSIEDEYTIRLPVDVTDIIDPILSNGDGVMVGSIIPALLLGTHFTDIDIAVTNNYDQIVERVSSNNEVVARKDNKITIRVSGINIDIFKIDMSYYKLVSNFHVPCVRAWYDGKKLHCLPSFVISVKTKAIIDFRYINSKVSPSTILNKYIERGFELLGNLSEKIDLQTKYETRTDMISKRTDSTVLDCIYDNGDIMVPSLSYIYNLYGNIPKSYTYLQNALLNVEPNLSSDEEDDDEPTYDDDE